MRLRATAAYFGCCALACSTQTPAPTTSAAGPASPAPVAAPVALLTQDVLQLVPVLPVRAHLDVGRLRLELPRVHAAVSKRFEELDAERGDPSMAAFARTHLTEVGGSFLVGDNGVEGTVVVRTDTPIPRNKMKSLKPSKHGYLRGSTSNMDVTLADPRTWVISSARLRASVDERLGAPDAVVALTEAQDELAPMVHLGRSTASFVAGMQPSFLEGIAKAVKLPALANAVRGLRVVGGWVATTAQPTLKVVALTDSERSAGILSGLLLISLQAYAAESDTPAALAEVLRRIAVRSEGASIRAEIKMSRQELIKWIERRAPREKPTVTTSI